MSRKDNAGRMIPEADYCNEDDRSNNKRHTYLNSSSSSNSNNNNNNNTDDTSATERLHGVGVLLDKDGLVVPRKPVNPCVESHERRDLHRELMFHQKAGKTVLNQKSELQLALQKHKEMQLRKEAEQERMAARTPLEITLQQRARRLEELERGFSASPDHADESQKDNSSEPNEFLRMHAKLRGRVAAMP